MNIFKKMKSIFMYSILLVFCVGVGLVFTACNDDNHEHSVSAWTVVKAASCTEEGQRKGTCDGCGEEIVETISKVPHTVVEVKGTAATCEKDGLTDGSICGVCSTWIVKQQKIPMTGHNIVYEQISEDDNVDDEFTFHSWHCTNCGTSVESERCSYINEVHLPTCTEEGYTIHECQYCKLRFKHDIVEATGHRYQEDKEAYIKVYDDQGNHKHKRVCLNGCGVDDIGDCEFDDGVEVAATCTSKGYTLYTCNKCGGSYEAAPQDMIAHNFGEGWKPVPGNSFYHEQTCVMCGKNERQRCKDVVSYEAATCTEAGKRTIACDVCGKHDVQDYGQALGHKMDKIVQNPGGSRDASFHHYECSRAGCSERGEDIACEFTYEATSEQTCETDGHEIWHCKDCLVTYEETTQKLQHSWGPWEPSADGSQCESVCLNNPEHVRHQPHILSTNTTRDADCTNNGESESKCSECNYTRTNVINALGHDFENGISEWDVLETGHRRKCARAGCDFEEDETPHNFTECNFCECGYDGLDYTQVEEHFVVTGNSRVKNARKIIIPELHKGLPVKEIAFKGSGVFAYMSSLRELVLSNNLEKIGNYSFTNCQNLRTVTINPETLITDEGSKLNEIGVHAFSGCRSLTMAHFPSSLKIIGGSAFFGCSKLSDIIIPASVLDIGSNAFDGTAYMNDQGNWTNNVLYISGHLIKANNNIASTYTVQAGTVNISANAFENCTALEKIIIPGSVTEIDRDAFLGCTSLREVEFTGTFENWLHMIFENSNSNPMNFASSLTIDGATGNITIPSGTKKIPAGTFKNSSITSVTIPETVTEIGEEAFYGCESLENIYFTGNVKLRVVGKDAFTGSAYFAAKAHWDDGVLYIGGCLIAVDDTGKQNWEIQVEAGTYSIAAGAFSGNIKSITIASTVMYIGEGAFAGCVDTLEAVTFEVPTGWMAFNSFGIGRGVDSSKINGSDAGSSVDAAKYYVGAWIKNYNAA